MIITVNGKQFTGSQVPGCPSGWSLSLRLTGSRGAQKDLMRSLPDTSGNCFWRLVSYGRDRLPSRVDDNVIVVILPS